MTSPPSVRHVVDMMIELGLVDADICARQSCLAESLDAPLSDYGKTEQAAILELFSVMEIRYTFDYKTFRGIDECSDEERREWYESELQAIAACSRGMVTITDVRLVEDDTESELVFEANGFTESWPTDPGEEEDVEAAITFATYISDIPTGLTEKFCAPDPIDEDVSGEAVFGDPLALNRLGEQFGLSFN